MTNTMNTQHKISKHGLFKLAGILLTFTSCITSANEQSWYVKPYVGLSNLSSQTASATNTGDLNGDWDVDTSSGFVSGIGLGYRYNSNLSAELQWEYRTNDTDTTVIDTGEVFEGNYASSTIYLNGYYHFDSESAWTTYVGAGVGWTQEIDIDLEENGVERSFSGDGDIAFQVMAGADYTINKDWSINAEVRYSTMSSIDMDGEENAVGSVSGFDYNPLTIGIGLKYVF